MTTLSIKGRILAGSGLLILRLLSARTAAPPRPAPPRPASPRSTSLRIATHRIVIADIDRRIDPHRPQESMMETRRGTRYGIRGALGDDDDAGAPDSPVDEFVDDLP